MKRLSLQEIYTKIPPLTDCKQCGGCCGNIIITKLEMQNIMDYCEANKLTFARPVVLVPNRSGVGDGNVQRIKKIVVPQEQSVFTEKLDTLTTVKVNQENDSRVTFDIPLGGDCPLLINNKCSVYPVRPFICRLYGHVKGLDCHDPPKKDFTFTNAEANRLCRQAREAFQ